jgi:hypothetical protein
MTGRIYNKHYKDIKGDDLVIRFLKVAKMGRLRKKGRRQGARILRSEAYFGVRRNDEG